MKKRVLILVLVLFQFQIINLFAQSDGLFEPQSTLGGYGELHFNHEKAPNGAVKQAYDFHRFVWFLGYNFSEKWSFKSEIELEHNFVQSGQGELELEQAYINYHYADWFGFQAGVVLPSVGLVNENHEPPLFFGVERPEYHNKIIPTTWFGNGLVFYGNYKSFDYKLTIMEGLNNEKFSEAAGIRNGRRKGYRADAKNPLYNFRIDYLGFEGLKVGTSFTYNKASGDTSSNKINLFEIHAQYNHNNIISTFEYGTIDYEKGNLQSSTGYYLEVGYNFSSLLGIETAIIPFVRYSDYNTAAKTITGGDSEKKNHFTYLMGGINIKPLPQIVFKADIGVRTLELNNQKTELINLGVGYMF